MISVNMVNQAYLSLVVNMVNQAYLSLVVNIPITHFTFAFTCSLSIVIVTRTIYNIFVASSRRKMTLKIGKLACKNAEYQYIRPKIDPLMYIHPIQKAQRQPCVRLTSSPHCHCDRQIHLVPDAACDGD